jgi:1-deoxy-D-xylulose-5-phosphate synthase
MNEEELRNLMYSAQLEDRGPYSIRYPRGNGVMTEWRTPFNEIKTGRGRKVTNGEDIALLSIGHPGNFAQEAIAKMSDSGISIAHYDMRFVKPLDELLLHEIFSKFKKIITIEDGCIMGGFGSAIIEFMADQKYQSEVVRLGIPDEYIHHGTQEELWDECGFDVAAIIKTIEKLVSISTSSTASFIQAG